MTDPQRLAVNPVAALLLAHQLEVASEAWPACPHGDPYCPCQDGDSCHYEDYPGSPAMSCAHCGTT